MKERKNNIKLLVFVAVIILIAIYGVYSGKSNAVANTKIIKTESMEAEATKRDIIETLTAPGEVKSEKEETLKLNTSYYYSTICAEENEKIKAGANLLRYTNGTYLKAPYDCVITSYYVPKVNSICTDSHYIKISSIEDLYMDINIDEEELSQISVGQDVSIVVNYDESKVYSGSITKINETGTYSNGRTTFAAIASLKNDNNLKLGMSATCTVVIDKKENRLCVPIDSVTITSEERYVTVKNENGEEEKRTVETGSSDANYVEIISGLSEGEKVYYKIQTVEVEQIETQESKNPFSSLFGGGQKGGRRQ